MGSEMCIRDRGVLLVVARELSSARRVVASYVALGVTLLWFSPQVYARARDRWDDGDWNDVQYWVRANTPRTALFLTPPSEFGFRTFSERAIVGEYKDGTQQYFDDGFVHEWGARMVDLAGGANERPDRFFKRSDADILGLAAKYGASYVVLPNEPAHPTLTPVYSNRHFTVYLSRPR